MVEEEVVRLCALVRALNAKARIGLHGVYACSVLWLEHKDYDWLCPCLQRIVGF